MTYTELVLPGQLIDHIIASARRVTKAAIESTVVIFPESVLSRGL